MKFINTNTKTPLKIIKFGGTDSATKNFIVYECADDILIFDCGIGLPDSELHGVDVVIPDFSYVIENQHKVRGLIVTHAHEDHFGAVPYLLDEINVPIYTTKLVQEFIKMRIPDRSREDHTDTKFTVMDENTRNLKLGVFDVSAFRVNHSVPHALGFAIKTPQGTIMHISDFKVDFAPVIDKPIDLGAIAKYADEGILCLLSDCLGATTDGFTKSEKSLDGLFPDLFDKGEGRQIFITTISSNISRMHQIIEAAIKAGRKVVTAGRSIDQSVKIARSLGILQFDDAVFVSTREANDYLQKDLVYIIAGCYGQQGSGLDRVARREHRDIMLEDNALVIFSADPNPPGVQVDVERLLNTLTINNAEVIYNKIQDNLHVSGHGAKGDLSIVASIAHPKYFIPIGGEPTKMRAYKHMIEELGMDGESVFEVLEGESIEFLDGNAKKGKTMELKKVYVDGSKNLGEVVIRDREQLASDGVFVVVVPMDTQGNKPLPKCDVITRGFVYVKESKQLMGQTKDLINKVVSKSDDFDNMSKLQNKIERDVSKFLRSQTNRSPMVMVHFIKV